MDLEWQKVILQQFVPMHNFSSHVVARLILSRIAGLFITISQFQTLFSLFHLSYKKKWNHLEITFISISLETLRNLNQIYKWFIHSIQGCFYLDNI